MAEKETKSCSDCIHLDVCYKIEHFGRDLETNTPCREFIGVSDRVEVVRCKDCRYYRRMYKLCSCRSDKYNVYLNDDDFCSFGEREKN